MLLIDALAPVGQVHRRGQATGSGRNRDRFAGGQPTRGKICREGTGLAKAGNGRIAIPGQ